MTWGRGVWSCEYASSSFRSQSALSSWLITSEVCLYHLSTLRTAGRKDSTPSLYSNTETARTHPCQAHKQSPYCKHHNDQQVVKECWQKAASHIVPSLWIEWFLSLRDITDNGMIPFAAVNDDWMIPSAAKHYWQQNDRLLHTPQQRLPLLFNETDNP